MNNVRVDYTKLIIGVACFGAAVYLYMRDQKSKKPFTGADLLTGMPSAIGERQG